MAVEHGHLHVQKSNARLRAVALAPTVMEVGNDALFAKKAAMTARGSKHPTETDHLHSLLDPNGALP